MDFATKLNYHSSIPYLQDEVNFCISYSKNANMRSMNKNVSRHIMLWHVKYVESISDLNDNILLN